MEKQYLDWMGKYLSGNIDRREKEALLRWVEADPTHRDFFDETVKLWKLSDHYEEEFVADVPAAWQRLADRIPTSAEQQTSTTKVRRLSTTFTIWRVAAAVLLLLAVGYWWSTEFTGPATPEILAFATEVGQQKTVDLPDGSTVVLNEQTELSYTETEAQRKVTLTGEGFFEVARMEDRPFVIQSGATQTTVLGTSFNVRAYPTEDRVEVTVETGLVRFSENIGQEEEVNLPAGESAVFIKPEGVISKVEQPSNATAWKTKTLRFDKTPMRQVILTLERYYGREIEVGNEAILKCPYNGVFENKSLEFILDVISFAMDFTVSTLPNGAMVLQGDGC